MGYCNSGITYGNQSTKPTAYQPTKISSRQIVQAISPPKPAEFRCRDSSVGDLAGGTAAQIAL
eukprot:2462308-Rhodomonas_salina.2